MRSSHAWFRLQSGFVSTNSRRKVLRAIREATNTLSSPQLPSYAPQRNWCVAADYPGRKRLVAARPPKPSRADTTLLELESRWPHTQEWARETAPNHSFCLSKMQFRTA